MMRDKDLRRLEQLEAAVNAEEDGGLGDMTIQFKAPDGSCTGRFKLSELARRQEMREAQDEGKEKPRVN